MPLVYRQIIDVGIADKNTALVVELAGVLVLIALAGAAISLTQRWFSARIGEGLIYDLRTQVFDHVQRSRWPSSPAPRRGRSSRGSTPT